MQEAYFGFPGNGVHSSAYFEKNLMNRSENRIILEAMNRHAGYDIVRKMFDSKERKQIADEKGRQIATVGGSVMNASLLEKLGVRRIGSYGLSLGAWSAAAIECIDLDDEAQVDEFFRAVAFRSDAMSACVPVGNGYSDTKYMAAIENLRAWRIKSICRNVNRRGNRGLVEIIDKKTARLVNENLPLQNVISGQPEAVEKVIRSIERKYPDAAVKILDTGGPWHNPDYMKPASEKVKEDLQQVPFSEPKNKLLLTSRTDDFVNDPEEIRSALGDEISLATRFYKDTIRLMQSGIRTFVDAGPNQILKRIWEKIPNLNIIDRVKFVRKVTREIPIQDLEKKIEESTALTVSSPSAAPQEDSL
ncbi:hypothetical protein GF358_03150 [Candidatus Woesearchaeota archaeon]|nr:hypothetical protein [Candidatus Woesearchaeota archaeon]